MMQTDKMNLLIDGQQDQRENTLLCSFCFRIFDNFNDLEDHLILHDPLNLSNGQCEDYVGLDCVNENINFDSRNSMNTCASKLITTKQNYFSKQQQLSPAIHSLQQLKNVMFKRKRDNDNDEEAEDVKDNYKEEDYDDTDEETEVDYDCDEKDGDADEESGVDSDEDDDSDDEMDDDDDDEEEGDSNESQDEDKEEEMAAMNNVKDCDDRDRNEQRKGVKRKPYKVGVKEGEDKIIDKKIRNIDQMAYTETFKYKLLMQSDIIRRLQTMVKTMKKSPRTHENGKYSPRKLENKMESPRTRENCKYSPRKPENKMESPRTHKNNNRLFALDGGMTIHKSTQTESINEDQGCCQCRTCTCKCHTNLRNDIQNALKYSKQMFQANIFPKEKDKKKLSTKTVTIQTVNKWFINYRYHFFLHIKKNAADTISPNSTTLEINRLTNKHYTKCFQCVSKNPKHHSKQQVKRAFMAWRFALKNNLNPEKYMRQALKS